MAVIHRDGLSTAVRIRLEVEGMVLGVSQVGEEKLILRDACQTWPTDDAQIVISIDGDEMVYPIALPHGIDGRQVTFTDKTACRATKGNGSTALPDRGDAF